MRIRYALLCLAGLALSALPGQAKTMSCQVKEGALRASPSYLGRVTAVIAYGDKVDVITENQPWLQVQAAGNQGWIHESALTTKTIKLSAGNQDARIAASTDELALAGKGFNSDVEAQFREENSEADYSDVNKMEAVTISMNEIAAFLQLGGVQPREGGVQ